MQSTNKKKFKKAKANKKGVAGGYTSEQQLGAKDNKNNNNDNTPFRSKKPEQRRMSHDLVSKVKEYKDMKANFEIEYDYGNIEYKLKLTNANNSRIEELVTQMKFRLQEGAGTCYYKIGIEDNGNPVGLSEEDLKLSLDVLEEIAERLNATPSVMSIGKGKMGFIAEIIVKLNEAYVSNKLEINIGLLGEYSSGKSTLVIIFL